MESEKNIYQVEIEEVLQKVYDIEANSIDEAISIAEEKYYNQEYILEPESIMETNFREFKDEVIRKRKVGAVELKYESKLRDELYSKLSKEYENYIETLLKKSPKEIIECSEERIIKEEILSIFSPELQNFDVDKLNVLLKEKAPLEKLYQGWIDNNLSLTEIVKESVNKTIDNLSRLQKEKNKVKDVER